MIFAYGHNSFMPKCKTTIFNGRRWDKKTIGYGRDKQPEERWKMVAFEILAQLEEERAKKQ
jgi:hypothetical protein